MNAHIFHSHYRFIRVLFRRGCGYKMKIEVMNLWHRNSRTMLRAFHHNTFRQSNSLYDASHTISHTRFAGEKRRILSEIFHESRMKSISWRWKKITKENFPIVFREHDRGWEWRRRRLITDCISRCTWNYYN
jgi:hypothetical protein